MVRNPAVVRATLATLALLLGSAARAQTLESTLTASDAAFGDLFGNAIGIDGDTILVGSRADGSGTGSGYVYRKTGGSWSQEAKLSAAGALTQDQVGFAVSLNAGAALLGAPDPFDPFGPPAGPGSTYVFRRSGTVWSQEAELTASDGASTDQFGFSVALSGSGCVIGARGDQATGNGSRLAGRGSAYVFRKSGAVWSQEAKLIAGDGVSGDRFGSAVAIEVDLIVIGAPGDVGPGADAGSAYIFRKSGAVWSQEAKLTASDAAAGDTFGSAVSVSGNAVIIGAYQDDGAVSNSGSAYIFRKNGALWLQEAKLTASDAAAGDNYGVAVSMLGDKVAVGAYGKSAGLGGAYVHRKVGASWSQQFNITKPGTGLLGSAVGISTDSVALGAPATDGVGLFSGTAYVYNIAPPPVLVSINPTSGLFHQQTPVTLTGTDFAQFATASVTFGGVAATNVAWVSPTQRTCNAPTGTQGTVVSVTLTENGVPTTLTNAYTYTGTTITNVSPGSGPSVGGPPVTITGTHFINNGSTTVTFGGNAASIVSITPPSTIVVNVPPGTRGSTVTVALTSDNGSASLPNAFTYETLSVTAIDKVGGNITGGTSLTLTVDFGTTVPDTTATLGGSPVTVTGVTPTSVTIVTPAVAEATGNALAVSVTNSNGTGTLNNAFTYTPSLYAPVTGNTVSGGTVTLDWLLDPAAGTNQAVTVWLGDIVGPALNATINGYAGKLQRLPLIFILGGWPEATHPVVLNFGPLDPVVAGFPLHLQAIVTGEGGPKGSFTNDRLFVIP